MHRANGHTVIHGGWNSHITILYMFNSQFTPYCWLSSDYWQPYRYVFGHARMLVRILYAAFVFLVDAVQFGHSLQKSRLAYLCNGHTANRDEQMVEKKMRNNRQMLICSSDSQASVWYGFLSLFAHNIPNPGTHFFIWHFE